MSSLIFKEFEEFGRIPKTEDVAYEVTKQIYGLDFADTFMKKGGGKNLNDVQRITINDATRQELITLHCKKLGSRAFRYQVSFNGLGLPHEKIDAFSFTHNGHDLDLNLDKEAFSSASNESQAFYLMDDLDEIWKAIYNDHFTFGFIKSDTKILLSLVRFLVNEVRSSLNRQNIENQKRFQDGKDKIFHPFYCRVIRQIISILFEQHKIYYKRYLSDIQIDYLFKNHRFTEVNPTLAIVKISKLIGELSTLHGGRPIEVFEILGQLNRQDVETRNHMDLKQVQNKILHSMYEGVN